MTQAPGLRDRLADAAGAWAGHTLSCPSCRGSRARCGVGRDLLATLDSVRAQVRREPAAERQEQASQAQGTLW